MQISLYKPQPTPTQKVKNILVRSFTKDRQDTNPKRPENSYILKCSPKYYRSLAIEIRPHHPLLSKIKKIKKLKRLEGHTGASFKEILPQDLWFNLLKNSRKEIEEFPQIFPNNNQAVLRRSFWKRTNLQKLKFFPNVTRVLLSKWMVNSWYESDPFVSIKESFVRYIWNLRRLRSLEISVISQNYEQAKWVFEKLDGMGRLFERLETFTITITNQETNVSDLFQYKNLLSYLVSLSLYVPFDPIFAEIPQICKNLKSFSFEFSDQIDEISKVQNLMASMQNFKQLRSIEFVWPQETDFWGYFKPPSSLRQLTLELGTFDLQFDGLFRENTEPNDAVGHWEEIQELDVLAFRISCSQAEEIIFAKQFITMILKKVQKVRSFRYSITCPYGQNEPFFVEEVPHLYESLERFEYSVSTWSHRPESPRTKLDLKMMKPFRNLKEVKLDGCEVTYENVEEIVSLLEENQNMGSEIPTLKINSISMINGSWLGETLKKIDSREKVDKNLEMLIDLTFIPMHLIDLLERLCRDIQAVKTIKGLVISLSLQSQHDFSPLLVERTKEILKKYSEIRNVKIALRHGNGTVEFRKLDGEKEEFIVNNRN